MKLFFFTLVQLLLHYLYCQLNLLLTDQKLFRKYLFLVLVAMEMMEVLAKLNFLHHYFNFFFLMELAVKVKCCGTLVFQEHQNYEINYFHLFLVLTYHIYEIIHAYLFEVLALVLAFWYRLFSKVVVFTKEIINVHIFIIVIVTIKFEVNIIIITVVIIISSQFIQPFLDFMIFNILK